MKGSAYARHAALTMLAAGSIALFANPQPASAATACDLALSTVRAGQLDIAAQQYQQLLVQKPVPTCAAPGYASVAARRRQAVSLADQGATAAALDQPSVALADAARALRVDPSSADARTLLRNLTNAPADPYAGAQALYDAGYRDEARTQAREVATTAEGTGIPIPADLRATSSYWERMKARADDFVSDVGSYASALGIPFAILLALGVIVWALLRRFLSRPRISLEKLTAADEMVPNAVTLTAMLVDELGSSGSGASLFLVSDTPSAPQFDLTPVLGDRWKWVAALWSSIPRRTLRVCGDASMITDHEAQVVLTIAIGNRVKRTRTFSFRDEQVGKTELLGLVLREAAAWLAERLVEYKATKGRRPGAPSWQSWGKFRQAVWYHEHGRYDAARMRYVDAVAFDHDNAAAWLNLANMDSVDAHYETALQRLDIAEACVAKRLKLLRRSAVDTSTVWYRIMNVKAVTLLNRASTDDPEHPERNRTADVLEAQRTAGMLVSALARVRLALIEQPPSGDRKPFAELLPAEAHDLVVLTKGTEDSAIALLASSLVAEGELPAVEPVNAPDEKECWRRFSTVERTRLPVNDVLMCLNGLHSKGGMHWMAQYNLACMYAHAYESAGNDTDARRKYLDKALACLRLGVEGRPARFLAQARDDPAFTTLRKNEPIQFADALKSAHTAAGAPTEAHLNGWKLTVPA